MMKLLEVKNLTVFFFVDSNKISDKNISHKLIDNKKLKNKIPIKAVDDVSFDINSGEVLGIAGESGSGKSVTSHSIINLIPSPPGKIMGGEIIFRGSDILKLTSEELRNIRGKEIGMIFQDPMVSLNPVLKIKSQINEAIMLDKNLTKTEIENIAAEKLNEAGITDIGTVLNSYPHQLSGGLRQRVMIAISLSRNPSLLIADEPTTALDVTIQKQILDLLVNIKQNRKDFSILLITHNLGIIKKICDRVLIMYGGKIQESAGIEELFGNPMHPYTIGLINCFPDPNIISENRITEIPGNVPDAIDYPKGCKFHPRCNKVMDICKNTEPELLETKINHFVRCHLFNKDSGTD
jgi:peptide/nickel transport system ATP-binding protein